VAVGLAGCASVNPTLAPARVLPAGVVAADLGSAYNALAADSVLRRGHEASARLAAGVGTPQDRDDLVRSAVVYGQTPPGLAPYAAARLGVGHAVEVQLAALGRIVRVGARRVFWSEDRWALSLGAQGRFAFWPGALGGVPPGLEVRDARLVGGDLTAVLGRTTRGSLYDVWMGLRAGYARGDGTMALDPIVGGGGGAFDAAFDRLDVAATLGLRVGLGHLAVLAEMDTGVGLFWGRSSLGVAGSGSVLVWVPAAALSYAV
jgi:hypothetical protein